MLTQGKVVGLRREVKSWGLGRTRAPNSIRHRHVSTAAAGAGPGALGGPFPPLTTSMHFYHELPSSKAGRAGEESPENDRRGALVSGEGEKGFQEALTCSHIPRMKWGPSQTPPHYSPLTVTAVQQTGGGIDSPTLSPEWHQVFSTCLYFWS